MTTARSSRQVEILALLTAGDPLTPLVARVCEVSAQLLGVSGAGMCLVGGRRQQIIVHGTDPLVEGLEDLQVALGEGPCIEAVRTGAPVLVPQLTGYVASTWPRYAAEALLLGVRALFTFPLQAGGSQLGALDLYRDSPGALEPEQIADAQLLTGIATRSMLAQRDRTHLDGSVSALRWLTDGDRAGTNGSPGRAVDLGITVAEALAPTRADGSNDPLATRPAGDGTGNEH